MVEAGRSQIYESHDINWAIISNLIGIPELQNETAEILATVADTSGGARDETTETLKIALHCSISNYMNVLGTFQNTLKISLRYVYVHVHVCIQYTYYNNIILPYMDN